MKNTKSIRAATLGAIAPQQITLAESRARQADARCRAKLAGIDLLKVSGKLVR